MSIILIAGIADNGVIGKDNDLPWYIPEDLRHFKNLTVGHTVVMGRKTYESIIVRLGKPLPNRKNIVITRQKDYKVLDDVVKISDISEIPDSGKVYIIGGSSLYELMLSRADILEITHIHQEPEGDTYFPKINWEQWEEVHREDYDGFSFVKYKRNN